MRCACGESYNTDDTHIGKQLRCRCGRTITIARPKEEYAQTFSAPKTGASNAGASNAGASMTRRRKARAFALPRVVTQGIRRFATDSVLAIGSRRRARRLVSRTAWLYLIGMLVSWFLLVQTSEQFLPATLLAYGPRFVLLAPLALLVPASLLAVRSAMLPLALAALVGVGPIMGGHFSFHSAFRAPPLTAPAHAIRVLSYNTMGLPSMAERLPELLALNADLMTFEECSEALADALDRTKGLHTARMANLCTASRWPITGIDTMPRNDLLRSYITGTEGAGLELRTSIATPYGRMFLVNVHLETARKGLEGYMGAGGFVPDNVGALLSGDVVPNGTDVSNAERLARNVSIRERESERAALWAIRGDKSVPVVVAGDFNLPAESTIYRAHWGSYTDAFASSGTGFGFSKFEGVLLRIRVDHILTNDTGLNPIGAWIGEDFGSDHRPVVADIEFPRSR